MYKSVNIFIYNIYYHNACTYKMISSLLPKFRYITKPTTRYKQIHMMCDYNEYIHYIHIWTHQLLSMVMELNVNNYKYVSENTKC